MVFSFLLSDFFFRCVLFTLVALKASQLFKSYFKPYLIQERQLERNKISELLEKEKLLASTKNKYETQLFSQKQMFMLLEKNIQVWHQKNQNSELSAISERVRNNQALSKRLENALNTRQTKAYLQKNKIALIEQAREELIKAYKGKSGEDALHRITADICQEIKS